MTFGKSPRCLSDRVLGLLAVLAVLVLCPLSSALGLPISPGSLAKPHQPEVPLQAESPLLPGEDLQTDSSPISGSSPPSPAPQDLASPPDPAYPDKISTPSTFLLFATGLISLAVWRRRKDPPKPQR